LFATEKLTRGVCPYAGALLDAALCVPPLGRDVAALVLTTACDQMRYVAAMLEVRGRGPMFLLNLPSTWQTPAVRQLYRDELGRLGRFLVRLGGRRPSDADLSRIMLDFDRARRREENREGEGERGKGGDSRVGVGGRVSPSAPLPRSPSPIPLAVVGGPLLGADGAFFELVARAGGRVVLDGTEGGQRALPRPFDRERVASDPFGELADAYFDGIPDAFRRPNTRLYEWLDRELAASGARGVILRRYVWCDLWHAESQRLKQWSPVPVLEIDVGPEDEAAPNRVQGRIEAFLETLKGRDLGIGDLGISGLTRPVAASPKSLNPQITKSPSCTPDAQRNA
jgi:benzoyl-CoA reductase/2-hydroxyglutaryl-CoA dehydratase subunit BcrC/BadD/HgdB